MSCTTAEVAAYACLTVQRIGQLVVFSHDDRKVSALIYLVSLTAYAAASSVDCVGLHTAPRYTHSRVRARSVITATVHLAQRPSWPHA